MEEEIVKEVLLKYFEMQGKQPRKKLKQASGPDIIIEGKAIEIKGSNIDKSSALNQLATYLSDYEFVEIAFPCDMFSIPFIYNLRALEEFSRRKGIERSIPVYLVTEMNAHQYAVLRFSCVRLLLIKVDQILYQMSHEISEETPEKKWGHIIRIEEEIKRELKNQIRQSGDKIII